MWLKFPPQAPSGGQSCSGRSRAISREGSRQGPRKPNILLPSPYFLYQISVLRPSRKKSMEVFILSNYYHLERIQKKDSSLHWNSGINYSRIVSKGFPNDALRRTYPSGDALCLVPNCIPPRLQTLDNAPNVKEKASGVGENEEGWTSEDWDARGERGVSLYQAYIYTVTKPPPSVTFST